MTTCTHKRLKKNFPFGRNSKPIMHCKDCGEVITHWDLKNPYKRRSR